MTIGGAFRRLRSSLKLNQAQMASTANIPLKSYQAYEYDKSVPSARVVMRMADIFNVSTDYVLGRSDMPQPTNFDEREVKAAFAAREELRQLRSLLVPAMANQPGAISQ